MSILLLCVGVALVYIVPDYVIKALNDTAVFSVATVNLANTQLALVRGAGFAVIIIAVIWMIISVVAGGGMVAGGKRGG
jgi:ABC-type Na+ efflux pump permease subunit